MTQEQFEHNVEIYNRNMIGLRLAALFGPLTMLQIKMNDLEAVQRFGVAEIVNELDVISSIPNNEFFDEINRGKIHQRSRDLLKRIIEFNPEMFAFFDLIEGKRISAKEFCHVAGIVL